MACYNTIYKLISELPVKRLKPILPQLILPNQTAFVKGRLLLENTLLASEIIQGCHRKRGPKRITLKVDITKAFDTLRWKFLFKCLRSLHLPELYLRWLEAFVCTPSFSMGFNGSIFGYFKRKRGLRHGDPLSPTLFVIAMNCLSYVLNQAAMEGKFGYHSNCEDAKLTHLCFADNLLIFTEGSLDSVKKNILLLKDFELKLGLALNISKTCFFSVGLSNA